MRARDRRAHRGAVRRVELVSRKTTPKGTPRVPTPTPFPSLPSEPPSSWDVAEPEPVSLKGIPGSPGVAVGPALVLGDLRASYARRHLHTAQIQPELDRIQKAVVDAKQTLREVSAKLPQAMRDASPILDAYELMLADPTLHERVSTKVRGEKKCAEWAVSEACEDIVALFGPKEIAGRDAYITERRHDIEFVCDRLLRALAMPRLGVRG